MCPNRILKATIVSIFTVLLILSPLSPLLADPQPAVAGCVDCGVTGETIELKYDNGTPFDQMKSQYGGCQKCQAYQGVLFTLPKGVSSSLLKKVSFYAGGGKADMGIHIMSTSPTDYFTPWDTLAKSAIKVSGADQWYEVNLPDIQVPNRFWVFLELTDLRVAPFYDERREKHDGLERSYNGYLPRSLVTAVAGSIDEFKRPQGDFMIRAYLVPEATVGRGEGHDYETIQEAIDSVEDGWRISVDEGTYDENVTVDKSVIIRSLLGPAKTVVQTSAYSDRNVFRITANCVKLSGFTIQSDNYSGGAGVYIDHASSCVISGNVIQGKKHGIYVSESSMCNILLENECKSNVTGIYVDGSENYISGNNLHGNTAAIGSAVFLSSIASLNQLRFNTVTVDSGNVATGPQVYNQSNTEKVSAVENWWGTDTGPYHPANNAGGQGPVVGDNISFNPVLAKQPVRVMTVAAQAGPFVLDARSETSALVVKQGAGSAFVSVAKFAENPAGQFRYKTPGKWIDVLFSSSQGIDEVEIRMYYTADVGSANKVAGLKEGSLRLFWWNGEKWKVCSKTKVDKENDFVWARLNLKTKPMPSDLTGTMFAVGIPKGGFAWWLIPLIIVIVIILLVVFRLFWVLVVRREGRYTSID
jgi:parallel beta-helix repeat protein